MGQEHHQITNKLRDQAQITSFLGLKHHNHHKKKKKKKKVDSADIYACVNYRLFQKFKLLGYGKLRVHLETTYLAEQIFFAKSTVDKAKK